MLGFARSRRRFGLENCQLANLQFRATLLRLRFGLLACSHPGAVTGGGWSLDIGLTRSRLTVTSQNLIQAHAIAKLSILFTPMMPSTVLKMKPARIVIRTTNGVERWAKSQRNV